MVTAVEHFQTPSRPAIAALSSAHPIASAGGKAPLPPADATIWFSCC